MSTRIDVGHVLEEFRSETDDGEPAKPNELLAYVSVAVTIDATRYQVGTMIGHRESEHDSCRASGAGISYGGGPDAWWCDASDWAALPAQSRDDVAAALGEAANRLWREVEQLRAEES